MKGSIPGKSNFIPTNEDGGALSTRREAMGAKAAYEASVRDGFASVGTWAVTVAEAHQLELPTHDDEAVDGNPPFHASVHFRDLSRKQIEKRALKLHEHAMSHGCKYRPPTSESTTSSTSQPSEGGTAPRSSSAAPATQPPQLDG